ncbi:MaoC family dehydratase OS=Streptomyces tendae OX=1932 GN=F3L20_09355 PE=3 SV=1 [Streptomyces tendae]
MSTTAPTRCGSPPPSQPALRLRATATISSVEEVQGGVQVATAFVVEREGGDKPVCVAESVARYYL